MKLSIISTAALVVAATAVPHRRHEQHHRNRRDVVYDTVTDVVTQTAPAAVVYVDQNGNVLSTAVNSPVAAYATQKPNWGHGGHKHTWGSGDTTTAAPSSPESTSAPESSYVPPAPESSEAPASGQASAPSYSSPAESSPAPAPASSSPPDYSSAAPAPSASAPSGGSGSGAAGYGLSYSPYNSDSSCKTQDQVNEDINALSDYGYLRIYGTDCDQTATVLKAATAKGMKIFAGVYDVDQVESETQTLIDAAKGDWSAVDTVSIGNEYVNDGGSPATVVAAVKTARSLLQAAGYTGNVVTVDTFNQLIAYPELCQASDFAAANCHAFFDSSIDAAGAGQYVKEQAQRVQQACGGMATVITESGWPSGGDTNGAAVPSEANQKTAIASLRSAFSSDLVLFSAYNDLWKANSEGTFDAEHYWGIYGMAPSS